MSDVTGNTPIVFLDIDGVLQPVSSQKRFDYDMTALQKELAEQFNDDIYQKIDKYDVAAVWVDWEKEAVANLKELLSTTGAKLVLSTGWRRFHVHKELIALFRLHGLDSYIVGQTRLLSFREGDNKIGFEDYESQEIWRDSERYSFREWNRIREKFDLEEYGEPKYKVYSSQELEALADLPYVRTRIKRAKEKYAAQPYATENRVKNTGLCEREEEILLYIREHGVKNYISLDDIDLYLGLGLRAVTVSWKDRFFNKCCLEKALGILQK